MERIKIKNVNPQKAYEAAKYIEEGGKITCGHDIPKDVKDGEVFYCPRCAQFIAAITAYPWISKDVFDNRTDYSQHHMDGRWYIPIPARITSEDYRTITPFCS